MKRDSHADNRPFLKSRPELFDTVMAEQDEITPVNQCALSTYIIGNNVPDVDKSWPVGYRLDDRFEIKEIRGGRGVSGMGIVFIVEDDQGRYYAVKTLQRRFRQELNLVQRFVREARTWMLLGLHPNIVCARHLDIIEAIPCLFIEYVPSDSEGNHALSHRLNHGPLNTAQVLDLAHQFCAGMIHATQAVPGLVHRDIKPENLLLAPDGTLKITDFGLVRTKAMSDDTLEKLSQSDLFDELPKELTRIGSIFGTPAYMAPEQFLRANEVTFRADIYALGCCLYETLAGLPPFVVHGGSTVERLIKMKRQHLNAEPPAIREVAGNVCPPSLERVIRKCLVKKPEERWESYEALSIAVLSIMDSLDIEARDLRCPDPSPREVADQMRSITLLEGYDQAIHMRKLREGQEESPYAFHLALASYFHCSGDSTEEERQLSKALTLRGEEVGSESVSRLTELWIRQGHHARADVLLNAYLATTPNALEQVLEPVIKVACAQGNHEEALITLEPFGDTFRTRLLRTEIYRAQEDVEALDKQLQTMHSDILTGLEDKIIHLDASDTTGWSRADDPVLLETVLASLLPNLNCAILKQVRRSIWPNIGGYPDFAPDLAWLSYTLGEIAALRSTTTPETAKTFSEFADFLGYPSRLEKHLERDEYWFWMRESQTGKRTD